MARLNQFAFAGQLINGPNIRIGKIVGQFGLPQLRGSNWIAQNATGEQFIPKLHGGRDIILPLIVRDTPNGISQGIFDMIASWAATRTQSTLANILDTGTRTGMAECTGWTQTDMTSAGLTFAGLLTFHLADPWLYGVTVTGNVVPNAGLAFGTPVTNNISGPRTNWTAAMSGCISGQPIIVVHGSHGYTTSLSSIADNFATPYTWTKVDQSNTYNDCEVYVGTGGVGTSGTITVTAPSGTIGGVVVPMTGASVSAALAAIDAHANAHAASGSYAGIIASVTPSTGGEGAFGVALGDYPGYAWGPSGVITVLGAVYSGVPILIVGLTLYPTSSVALTGAAGLVGYPNLDTVSLIVKGSGAPVTLNITNSGTVVAEKLTLDFLGPITNPTITNTTNGTSITITATVAGTKHLIVDTGVFTALNDGTNVIGRVSHSGATPFLTLNPGVNALQVSGAACTGSTLVTVSFTPPFV